MQITLFTANCTGVKTNCIYPNKVVAESKAEMVEAIKRDHVCAKYTNNYRSNENNGNFSFYYYYNYETRT